MKFKSKLNPLVLAMSLAVTGLAVPTVSQAGASASFAVSNMYLWRGQNISNPGPEVSGSLDYSMNGFYAGVWTSSEGAAGSSETDLYLGYGGEVSGVSYDISYYDYLYPSAGAPGSSLGDTDYADVVLKLGYAGFGFGYYMSIDSPKPVDETSNDNAYMTLSYTMDKFSVTYGTWSLENDNADNYSHITFGYAATDSLSFALSKASADNNVVEENPLFAVTWSQSFDL